MIPFFLDLKNFKVLVFGYGDVSKRRILKLIESNANIDVYSQENPFNISKKYNYEFISYTACNISKLTTYELENLIKKYDIIITCVDKKNNKRIVEISKNLKKMVSSSTFEPEINFIIPAFFKKDDICFSIYTGGKSPLIAREVRKLVQNYLSDYKSEIELQEQIRNLLKDNTLSYSKTDADDNLNFKNQIDRKEILELAFKDEKFKGKILNLIEEYFKNNQDSKIKKIIKNNTKDNNQN
ncbi:precorrin-2 dehydrogenase/sirohydrochlorin ferrochelatase family protein [Methanococcus voltae]|uniref:precorrin-2 dehydrogenase n=1 Tax=Methanococcus voltae (strain ATCC BAA-1334 / A3) TaxID=456320 RepID=D7DQH0_METV3|nr:NAD(P)-dependent oxidoreductase [Methanococcus voltae]MCS3901668.1 precorrin-2 dehydrogenase/sirohydrochlorin ferrochelatase [Methanococcus voltae]